MKRRLATWCSVTALVALCFRPDGARAQIHVFPHWVSINTTGATTAFLTFDGASGFTSEEAIWCGEVRDATPDIGQKPVPGTIFGALPARLNLSSTSTSGVFTDIMSIPPSVARRAYQAAAEGERSTFFYVRHFVNTRGGPDQYVAVTCELSSGGAHTPFALTAVTLAFEDESNVATVGAGGSLPRFTATVQYTGTGSLHGRWEVVKPGDSAPVEQDLLTEATLPVEKRGLQRRYTEVDRFSMFLPPTGRVILPGPDPAKLPSDITGQYMILLRIETALDVESTSDFSSSGVTGSPVESGGVAGFPIPPLRYFVVESAVALNNAITLISPGDMADAAPRQPVDLVWTSVSPCAAFSIVVVDPQNSIVFSALVRPEHRTYRLDPWVWTKTDARHVDWSVQAVDGEGTVVSRSAWRTLWRDAGQHAP
jgi:hypothetical protein